MLEVIAAKQELQEELDEQKKHIKKLKKKTKKLEEKSMATIPITKTDRKILDYIYKKASKPGGMSNLSAPELNRANEWLMFINKEPSLDPYGRRYVDFRDAYEVLILEIDSPVRTSDRYENWLDELPELVTLTQEEYDELQKELTQLRLKVKMLESQDSFYEKLKIDDTDIPL